MDVYLDLINLADAFIQSGLTYCLSHLASLVGGVLLEDVAGADHHPGCLDTIECSALLLLHEDLMNKHKIY